MEPGESKKSKTGSGLEAGMNRDRKAHVRMWRKTMDFAPRIELKQKVDKNRLSLKVLGSRTLFDFALSFSVKLI